MSGPREFLGLSLFSFVALLHHARATMLRWTCRLRDVLERRGFLVPGHEFPRLAEMREAEFTSENGVFPSDFRWQALRSCLNSKHWGTFHLFNGGEFGNAVPAVDPHSALSISIRSISGQPVEDLQQGNINVLWLSPTVFIACVGFVVGTSTPLGHGYELTFYERGTGCVVLCATALSSLEGDEHGEPSPVPLEFFRHATALLPADYFDSMTLRRKSPERCPVHCLTRFLSIVPHHGNPTTRTHSVRVCIAGERTISTDEIRQILSHPFHPAVLLAFDENPFDESVSLSFLNDLLAQAPHLRAVQLPGQLVDASSARNSCSMRFEDIVLKSADLRIHCSEVTISLACFGAIAQKHMVQEMDMRFSQDFWKWDAEQRRELLRAFVHPFLDTDSSLENLCLRFHYCKALDDDVAYDDDDEDQPEDPDNLQRVALWVSDEIPAFESRNLCVLNASIVYGDYSDLVWSCNHIVWWDKAIVPRLVLNFYHKQLSAVGGVMGLAVRAVSQGIVYRKSTDHRPGDPSIANASLILRMINLQARCRSGFQRHRRQEQDDMISHLVGGLSSLSVNDSRAMSSISTTVSQLVEAMASVSLHLDSPTPSEAALNV
jgi:hypothetical protein